MYRPSRRTHLCHHLLLACALSGLAASAHAQNVFYTTGTYTIDATHSVAGNAYVGIDSSQSRTDSMGHPYNPTVNLVTGGSVGSFLNAFDSSTVTISSGSIGALDAINSSTVIVSGGSVGNYLNAFDSSTVTISSGSVNFLAAIGSSTFNVSGGTFGNYLDAENSSTVTISGGTFGQFDGVNFFDQTTGGFTLVGNNLLATNAGADINFGGTDYTLSGTLQSGTNLTGYVLNVQSGSTFTLQLATPEPGSVALLIGLSVNGLGLLARRKQRRKPRPGKPSGY